MKRIISLAIASFFTLLAYGQNDTIDYPFFDGTQPSLYSAPGGGCVVGSNLYNTEVGQTFETSSGNLTSFVYWAGEITVVNDVDTFFVKVYNVDDNTGLPVGGALATRVLRADSIFAGTSFADGGNSFTFDPAVPVSGKFAVVFDVNLSQIDDTLCLVSIDDPYQSGRSIALFPGAGGWLKLEDAWVDWSENVACWVTLENVVPSVTVSSRDLIRCSGTVDTLLVNTNGLAPDDQLNVSWSPVTGVTDPFSLQTQIATDAAVDSYTVSIYDPVLDSTFTAGVKYSYNDLTVSIDQASPVTLTCGGSTTLTATAGGVTTAASFTWDDNNNTNGLALTVSEAGTYTISGTNRFGCAAEASVTVNLNVTQTANFDVPSDLKECEQFTLTNTSSTLSGWDFTWYANGDTFTNTQNLTTTLDAGSYPVRLVADSAGLCSVTVTKNIGIQVCSSIEEALNGELIEVFPNPSNGVFSLNMRDVNSTDITVRVTDLSGKVVFLQNEVAGNSVFNLDLTGVVEGVYLLQVTTEESTMINKLQVTK